MKTFNLCLHYLRRLISYYIEGKEGSLSELIDIEAGLYHDLKGLYTKRLGLLINKYESGTADDVIERKIFEGASDVAKLFTEERQQLFKILSPDTRLVSLFQQVYKLEKAAKQNDIVQCLRLLMTIKEHSDYIYARRIQGKHFELASLLSQVAIELKPEKLISLNLSITDSRYSLKLSYADFNIWRRLFQNFIINGIEACEARGQNGTVEVRLSYPEKGRARVEIADSGIGMDSETLANFTKRGFTKGKTTGQGLGINEDAVAFINNSGKFEVVSQPNNGTTIFIELNVAKIAGSSSKIYWISPVLKKRLRLTGVFLIATAAVYLLLSILFEGLRLWEPPEIYRYKLEGYYDASHTRCSTIKAFGANSKLLWYKDFSPSYILNNEVVSRRHSVSARRRRCMPSLDIQY